MGGFGLVLIDSGLGPEVGDGGFFGFHKRQRFS